MENTVSIINNYGFDVKVSIINGAEDVKNLLSEKNPDFGYTLLPTAASLLFTPGTKYERNFISITTNSGKILYHLCPMKKNVELTLETSGTFSLSYLPLAPLK